MEDVPAAGPGFDSDSWIAAIREDAKHAIANGNLDSSLWGSKIATIAAMVRRRPLTILDFGGGLGTACLHLERVVTTRGELAYHVVEGKRVCEEGTRLNISAALRYHSALPALGTVDIVFARSSLQYIPEWRGLLGSLAAYRPQYILIEDLPAGAVPTFASAQLNMPGSTIPYWFFNLGEFMREVESHGYSLRLDMATTRAVAPRAFPASHQIGTTRDLLFERTS